MTSLNRPHVVLHITLVPTRCGLTCEIITLTNPYMNTDTGNEAKCTVIQRYAILSLSHLHFF